MSLNDEYHKFNIYNKSKDDSNYRELENIYDLNICHYCLSLIPSTSLKCPHCGEWITHHSNNEENNICSSCEQEIPWAALKCMHCGSWVKSKLEKNMNDLTEEEIEHEVDELIENLKHNL